MRLWVLMPRTHQNLPPVRPAPVEPGSRPHLLDPTLLDHPPFVRLSSRRWKRRPGAGRARRRNGQPCHFTRRNPLTITPPIFGEERPVRRCPRLQVRSSLLVVLSAEKTSAPDSCKLRKKK